MSGNDNMEQQMENEDEDGFEFRQAKFLADIRETEDIQDVIEAELLKANDRFAEYYALLLHDLDVAVDLSEKLEAIEEAADDVLARYSYDRSFSSGYDNNNHNLSAASGSISSFAVAGGSNGAS